MVQVTQFVRYRENPICQIGDGGHFGEIALLRADQRRTANVVTLAFCELQVQTCTLCTLCTLCVPCRLDPPPPPRAAQVLSRKRFEKIQRDHREFAALVHRKGSERLEAPEPIARGPAGFTWPLPWRTPPRPSACWLRGLRPLLRTPERRLSRLEARRGPRSPPRPCQS